MSDIELLESAALQGLAAAKLATTTDAVNYVLPFVGVVDGEVRVLNADGSVRMRVGHSPVVPLTICELARELAAGWNQRENRANRTIGQPLRTRPFGSAPNY
jgi:hypothetical protein